MGRPYSSRRGGHLAHSEKAPDGLVGILNGEVAKMLHRHAEVKGSFIGGKKPFDKRWHDELGGMVVLKERR
jgi:hypothetical protein